MFDLIKTIQSAKKLFTKKDIFLILSLILVYFLTRLINLEGFPIFSDEGIYIHWAKIAWHDATWRFVSLTDGRQPLQTWATIPFLKMFPDSALFAGRLFGVISGFLGSVGIFILSYYLFNKRVAYFSLILYIATPFFLFFDRLAMIDSLVNASFIWMFLFSIILINTLRFDSALIFGFASGMLLLAKSSVSLFLGLSIFAPLIKLTKNVQKNIRTIINFFILFTIVIFLSVLIYNIQRLSPFLHYVTQKNHTFVKTFDEFIKAPFSTFWYNLKYTPLHTAHNLGWATFIFGLIGFYLIFKKERLLSIYFLIWIFAPYIFTTFFMKVLYSRYIIFLLSPFVLFTAYFLNYIFFVKKIRTVIFYGLIIIIYIFTLYFDYTIVFNYKNIPFLKDDKGQYIEGWPCGLGIKEIIEYARLKSKEKPVILLAEGNFGMVGDVLDTFLKRNDNISIKAYWPMEPKNLTENQRLLNKNYVYAVSAHQKDTPANWPVKLIKRFDKPGNKSSIYFFELTK